MVINMINVSYMMGDTPIAGWFVSFTILMKIDDTSNWGYNGISIYISGDTWAVHPTYIPSR
jgi:hypothetical protein